MRKTQTKAKPVKKNTPPALKALTRGELVDLKVKELQEGKLTVQEVADFLGLNEKQLKFCELYTSPENRGNKLECVRQAYEITDIDGKHKQLSRAKSQLAKLMANQNVITMMNALIHLSGYSVDSAQKALGFLVEQHADLKMKGIAAKIILEAEGKLNRDQQITIKHQYDFDSMPKDKLMIMRKLLLEASGQSDNSIEDINHEEL